MDLLVAGNVQTIIQGHVTPQTMHLISVKAMPYALGGAAIPPGEELKIDETVMSSLLLIMVSFFLKKS